MRSPVLNSKGELIGLAFDGNWESLSGDILFEPEMQRMISVDIVYTISKPIVFFIEALSAYDTCRFAGLGFMPSVFTSLVYSGISIWEVKTKTVREELIKGTGINFLSDIALNLLINTFMPEPSEAAQNRVQHISQRNAAVAVGGSMRFAQFTDEWRDGLSVRP